MSFQEAKMNNPKFQIYKSNDGQFRFRLIARNGQIILNGEGYASKQGCQGGISSIKSNATQDSRYQRKTATNGQFFFTLVAANGETLGRSELYVTEQNREKGIEAVKRTAPDAPVEDTA